MERFKYAKEKFSQFLAHEDEANEENKSLGKITEESESVASSKILTFNNQQSFSSKKEFKVSLFFLSFFKKLQKIEPVYDLFLRESSKRNILKKEIKKNRSFVRANRYVEVLDFHDLKYSSNKDIYQKLDVNRSMRAVKKRGNYRKTDQVLSHSLEKIKNDVRIANGKTRRIDAIPIKAIRAIKKGLFFKLDVNDGKLRNIFKNIAASFNSVNIVNFSSYLRERYPDIMVEAMIKSFDFQVENLESYALKMSRFLSLPDKEHLKFCFEIFDINKDGFICHQDTFKALELRNKNIYDDDFIVIRELLQLKAEGKLSLSKMKRKSTFGLIRERIEKKIKSRMIQEELKIDTKTKINFSEFKLAKFINKPQILKDFFKYTCGFNYTKATQVNKAYPKHAVKESEDIVIDMNLDEEFRDSIKKDLKYNYYCFLDDIMSKYKENSLKIQLEKFKFLQSRDKFLYKMITKESLIENLPKIVGFRNEYINSRLFEILSHGKYLTKAVFLQSILEYIESPSGYSINKLAFAIYDSKNDGKITVDEISKMFSCLLHGSEAYEECLKIVNLFINTIFEKTFKKVHSVDFHYFQSIVSVSVIGIEALNIMQLSCEDLKNLKSSKLVPSEQYLISVNQL